MDLEFDIDEEFSSSFQAALAGVMEKLTVEQVGAFEEKADEVVSGVMERVVGGSAAVLVQALNADAPSMLAHRREFSEMTQTAIRNHWGPAFDRRRR